MQIKQFIFNPIQVNTYLLYNEDTHQAAIIDAGCLGEEEEPELGKFIDKNGLKVQYLLNTHLHLDHQAKFPQNFPESVGKIPLYAGDFRHYDSGDPRFFQGATPP